MTSEQLGGTNGLGLVRYSGTRDELEAKLRVRDDEIDRLRSRVEELEGMAEQLKSLVGYLVMERGREGCVMIGDGTLLRYDRFNIECDQSVRAGMLVRATPL